MAMIRFSLLCLASLYLVTLNAVVTANKSVGAWEEETGFYQSITVTDESPLVTRKSKYQTIEVQESQYYGKILVLDGMIQLTERDANSYNEMMAHIAMMQHKNPKRALIIGGGDGYVLSEVLKHASLEQVDHVDLDGDVIEICKEHFSWGEAWKDPRVTLHIDDGAAFVARADTGYYDVVIQDSADPWIWDDAGEKILLPSNVLYSEGHFQHIKRILSESGVFNFQVSTGIEMDCCIGSNIENSKRQSTHLIRFKSPKPSIFLLILLEFHSGENRFLRLALERLGMDR